MVMRESARGGADACREKAAAKVAAFVETLKDLTEAERFAKIHQRFDLAARCTAACAENFDPQKFEDRGNGQLPEVQLCTLIGGNEEGVEIMKALCGEMAKSPLSQVNGTSFNFAKCTERTAMETEILENNRRFFENAPRARSNVTELATRLGVALMPVALVLEDMLAA